MEPSTTAGKSAVSLGLFECCALVTAFVLQIASLVTSLQNHGCGATQSSGKVVAAEARDGERSCGG
jgi:hypothetical protein